MQTLSQELKAVIAKRLETAGSHEILTIASALCADEAPPIVASPNAAASVDRPRFDIQDDTVIDHTTSLQWSRDNIGGRMNWQAAGEACKALMLAGHSDWRLPTIRELLTLVYYDRHDPSIDPAFKCESSAYWTSTPAASSPVYAWFVYFYDGDSGWYHHDYGLCVRAVRASQSSDFWHVR